MCRVDLIIGLAIRNLLRAILQPIHLHDHADQEYRKQSRTYQIQHDCQSGRTTCSHENKPEQCDSCQSANPFPIEVKMSSKETE